MGTGAITQYVDVAQLVLYAFWAFFAGLIFYLVRENHREGYPMDSGRADSSLITGWPVPAPKVFKLGHGHESIAPDHTRAREEISAAPVNHWLGAGLVPVGDPLLAGIGPGAWAMREDQPDRSIDGEPVIRPLRRLAGFDVSPHNVDPRGLEVLGADGVAGGKVVEVWLDRIEMVVRFLEVQVAAGEGTRNVLLPMPFVRVKTGRAGTELRVAAILGHQFANVPGTAQPDAVTKREEDRIAGYYGAGLLYATPARAEPLA